MTTAAKPVAIPHMAFTCRYNVRSLRLTSEIEIFPAFDPSQSQEKGKKYQALYDTGATHSSISPKVVAELGLASVGAQKVGVGGGELTTTVHLVNIGLPNKVMFQMMRVAQISLHGHIDALIGMDILGVGDFAVTHHKGTTTFSFCCPSRKEIDFVTEVKSPVRSDKIGRNSPCPCGSGKKYKRCHGAA
jgi:predicted aspartyl protease